MGEIKFYCHYCGQQHAVSSDMAGKVINCTSCGNTLSVPELQEVSQNTGNMVKKCPFCAEEIRVEAIKCKHCGSMLNSDNSLRVSEPNKLDVTQVILSQDRFSLVPNENILIDGLATYIKSAINIMTAHAYLTNYRLVICNTGMTGAQVLFGPIGAAVALARKPTKITVQAPISEITAIVKGKHGFATRYTVHTRLGQYYDLQFTKEDEWRSALLSLGVSLN